MHETVKGSWCVFLPLSAGDRIAVMRSCDGNIYTDTPYRYLSSTACAIIGSKEGGRILYYVYVYIDWAKAGRIMGHKKE